MSSNEGARVLPSYDDESGSDRLARKARDAPFMVVGLCGLVGIVGYGIYGYRNRTVKTSVYIIHMRVLAQGFVVTCLTLGVGYNLFNKVVYPKLFPESIENGQDKKK